MLVLSELAKLGCLHPPGAVQLDPIQALVTVEKKRVLVEPDPESRRIDRCPMYGIMIKPCTQTLKVIEGYSTLVKIDGRKMCLDTITGLTNGTPPGTVLYKVYFAGQEFVSEKP